MDKLVDSSLSVGAMPAYDGSAVRELRVPQAEIALQLRGWHRAMTERQRASDPDPQAATMAELPPPDVVAFIRYCHRRRGFKWPELYDEMCGVAARREFNGWDHAELGGRGLTFSLLEMPRLSAWVRVVLARDAEPVVEPARPIVRQPMEAAVA